MGWKEEHDHHDHGHDHDHAMEPRKWILWVTTFLGALAILHMLGSIFGMDNALQTILDDQWIQLTFGLTTFILIGIGFIKGSIQTLIKKELSEDTLVAMAATSAFLYSISALIANNLTGTNLPLFFYEEIEVLWLIYVGRFIEDWLTHRVTKNMSALEGLKPKTSIVIRDGKEVEIPADEIIVGDIVIVKPGQLIPVDGIIIDGETTIDESSLTGESMPILKSVDSNVYGGTISSNGLIKVKALKIMNDSYVSQIINSVNESMKTKPKSQRMADRIAKILIPAVLVIGLVTFIATGLLFQFVFDLPTTFVNTAHTSSPWIYSFYILITILVIACPCSFSMTTPMSILVSSSTARKHGVIFSSGNIFEIIKSVDTICFDKTGTLTKGEFQVVEVTISESKLTNVLAMEKTSNHPLAKSIIRHFGVKDDIEIKTEEVIGKGLSSSGMKVGSVSWLKEIHTSFIEDEKVIEKKKQGSVFIYAFNDKEVFGYIELKDEIKSDALLTINKIRKMGIRVVMITGDQKETAMEVAVQLGIDKSNVYAEVNPNEKYQIVKNMQEEGSTVAFVGDGINDSVALTQADIGIAMGAGSDAATETADIVLNNDDLTLVAYSLWLSRRTLFTIKRGFGIAIAYNLIMVPLAATGVLALTGFGPALAALSMGFNDSVAMINATTLSLESNKKFNKKYKDKK